MKNGKKNCLCSVGTPLFPHLILSNYLFLCVVPLFCNFIPSRGKKIIFLPTDHCNYSIFQATKNYEKAVQLNWNSPQVHLKKLLEKPRA